jgi:hypothetical protein
MKKIAILLTFMALPVLANANLVANGSFEADSQSAGTWNILSSLTGWTGSAELRNNVAGTASDGFNFVELDTTGNSSIYQDFTGLSGLYNLSFDYSARPGVAKDSNPIQAWWNGALLTTVTGNGIGKSDNNWLTLDFLVSGTGNDKLTFTAAGISDSYGGSLDNVILTAVPEPETYGMMLAGLGLIGFVARRRRAD